TARGSRGTRRRAPRATRGRVHEKRRTTSTDRECSVPPRQDSPRQSCAEQDRRKHERDAGRYREHPQRRGVGRVTALLKREEHHAERFRARGPQKSGNGELVEGGEKDEQRAGRGGRGDERQDDGAQPAEEPCPGDLRGFLEGAIELLIAAD